MFRYCLLCCCLWVLSATAQPSGRIKLPNGWSLTPAGQSLPLGDLPLHMAISPSGRLLAVTNNGVSEQSLQLIDLHTQKVLCTTPIPYAWLGLQFSADETALYASGGNENLIRKYRINTDTLLLSDSIVLGKKWPEKISPTGLALDDRHQLLYVVTKENNSLYIIDLTKNKVAKQVPLPAEAYTCLLSPNGKQLYISVWGGAKVCIFDTHSEKITDSVSVGKNPNDMCLSPDGKFLFVANALDNSVSVIKTAKIKVIETLNAALYPDAPNGSTTNSVALSGNKLYIANADNNCLAVFDVSDPGHSRSIGFIPTGWYPTCVRVQHNTLLVTNGKGLQSLPNPKGPQPIKKTTSSTYKKAEKKNSQYIGSLFRGALSIIPEPDEPQLARYATQVYENTPYTKAHEKTSEGEPGNPIPMQVGSPSPIKHVFYIMKENRTYDQVLSDIPGGNGDTSLLLFGARITPNQHALAQQFVLLDNFYVDAEVSADGHNWSMAAYANDYVEKTWPTNYGRRGGNYDYAGNRNIALPRDGFLWDFAARSGISMRNYGEFTDDDGTMYQKVLEKSTCKAYTGWKLSYKDIDREQVWEHDFDSLSALHAVPQLNIIYLPNDHTSGLSKGAPTPNAQLADNDLAVGRLIDHLSHSPEWQDCAVFILEDDAQNGPDHIDAHRSTAYLAGPYVRRGFIDHTMYSTTGMLRTIELILGLPPMSQYDAAAIPMWRSFTPQANTTPFTHTEALVDINEVNVAVNALSRESDSFNLAAADLVPDLQLNRILWRSIKSTPFPAPRRAAFVSLHDKKED